MKKAFYIVLAVIATMVAAFFLGPKPAAPKYSTKLPKISLALGELEDSINSFELKAGALECAYTEILWADSVRQTEYVFMSDCDNAIFLCSQALQPPDHCFSFA